MNPLTMHPTLPVGKPKKLTQAKPCLSQMSKELHQYMAARAPQISTALDYNLSEMGKLSNGVEECVPINVGCLHAFSQIVVAIKVQEVYDDVGDIANVVAGGGGVRQSRSNTSKCEAINLPREAEVCS